MAFLRRGHKPFWIGLIALVAAAVAASLFTFGPLSSAARQRRLQTQAVSLYTAMMTDWVEDEPNGDHPVQTPMPAWYDTYLIDPAWGGRMVVHNQLTDGGGSVVAAGTPYFAVTRWAPLSDPDHTDALVGLTVCWVQGNLVTTKVGLQNQRTVTGPGPTGHAAQVFFKMSKGKDGSRSALRIYDIKDITPDDGTCPLD